MNGSYEVTYLPAALTQFRKIFERANARGMGQRVLDIGKEIDERLRADPIGFGDPLYHLRESRLDVFSRAISPLVVTYGVHQEERVVFVSHFEGMSELGE
jgi:hypothetical protein